MHDKRISPTRFTLLDNVRDVQRSVDPGGAHIVSWLDASCVTGERMARVFDPHDNPAASRLAERFFLDLRDREGRS